VPLVAGEEANATAPTDRMPQAIKVGTVHKITVFSVKLDFLVKLYSRAMLQILPYIKVLCAMLQILPYVKVLCN
jgi:hypothetical protein